MMSENHRSGSLAFIAVLVSLHAAAARGADDIAGKLHRVELPLKSPRGRDPVLGGSRDKVFFQLWIPAGVATLRGAVCNPFSKDEEPSRHWKAACRHWGFAYLQTDYDAVRKDDHPLLAKALTELAARSGRPEADRMPLCFLGMSRGGGMSMQFAELLADRTLAAVPVCLEVGPTTEPTRRIPVLTVFGEKDGRQMEQLLGKLPTARKDGARWAIAVQWGRKHEFGQANNLSFVFLDDVIARRLPKDPAGGLVDIPLEDGALADPRSWSRDGGRPEVKAWKDFSGDREQACWFPSARSAAVWRAFVSGSRDVTIVKPAGLGDGQPFVLHSAAAAMTVELTLGAGVKATKVELWDGDVRLAECVGAPWKFEVALKPGIHGLFATATGTDGRVLSSRPHTVVVAD